MFKNGLPLAQAVLAIFLIALAFGCQPPGSATPPPEAKATRAPEGAATASDRPAWQKQWNDVTAGAKQEGKVFVLTTSGPEIRALLINDMGKKYGIDVEVVTGRGAELTARLTSERRTGLYSVDIYQGGVTTPMSNWKPAGYLDPLEPALILPEVLDAKSWLGGVMPFIDRDKTVIGFSAGVPQHVAINTDLVRMEEIQSYYDLLNPKWKGQMVLFDPTLGSGSSTAFLSRLMLPDELGRDKAIQFMRDLVKQEPAITKDLRLQVEWVARGKYSIALGPQREQVSEFRRAGAPIRPIVYFREGIDTSPGSGGLALMNRAPHPNASRVFINWLLSKEGQTTYARSFGAPSARMDVPTDGLDPDIVPDPNKKYVHLGEETFVSDPETGKIINEIFAPLVK
ncbi:MAG: extracellular solute-binding protein [Chloroflexi bacterium]|nr:extracellular solute-binding protein [Chloroflexota bacterium]